MLHGNLRINLFQKIILIMGRCNMKRGKFGKVLIGTLTVGMLLSQGIPYNVLAEEVNTSTLTGIDVADSILICLKKEQRNSL
jgi:hypothetical protein